MSDTADSGPLTPGQTRWLKIAVVVMGIMIVVGIAVLIGRILYLASQGPRSAAPARAGPATEGSVALPSGATIRNLSLSGDRLAIHYDSPVGTGIAIVELATGRRLHTLEVVTQPPSPPRAPTGTPGRPL